MTKLHADNNEACAIADYNKDGILDVSAGEFWYAGPDYKPQKLRKLGTFGKDYMTNNGEHPFDVDGDGIPYRTYPGTHPTKGSFFTRGTSRDEYAVYTENGDEYVKNMNRLLKKWETAKDVVPAPEVYQASNQSNRGVIFFGTSTDSSLEALDYLADKGIQLDALRVKAFPFNDTVKAFIDDHDEVFVIEQNRDAQLRQLVINEFDIVPSKLVSVLEFGGMPITAAHIQSQIEAHLNPVSNVTQLKVAEQSS